MQLPHIRGTIPVLLPDNQHLFAKHWRMAPTLETYGDGGQFKTGFIALNQISFNLYDLCERTGECRGVYIDQILYADENDMPQVMDVKKHDPILTAEFHYTTKVMGLRWGVQLKIDHASGMASLKGDFESPILGVKLRLA